MNIIYICPFSKKNYEENGSFTEALREGIICETMSEDNENSRMPSRAPFNLGDNKAYLRNSSLSLFLRIKNTSFRFDFCVSLMR